MEILSVKFYATRGEATPEGKRRPTAFEPYATVDRCPQIPASHPYTAIPRGSGPHSSVLYFREHEGFANFFVHNPHDEAGFGGAVFSGTLISGESFSVRGPWSGSCALINSIPGLATEPLAHIAISDDPPHSWIAAFVTLSILREIEAHVAPHWQLEIPESPQTPSRYTVELSDQQGSIVDERSNPGHPYFVPTATFDDCASCKGFATISLGGCERCNGAGMDPRYPHNPYARCLHRDAASGAWCYKGEKCTRAALSAANGIARPGLDPIRSW